MIRTTPGSFLSILASTVIFVMLLMRPAFAEPLDGFLTIKGGFFPSSGGLSGDLNAISGTLQLNNPSSIYGVPASFLVTEYLGPGTYTRTHNLTTGGTITRTGSIPSGSTGAYLVISHNSNEYQIFNAWTVSANGFNYAVRDISGNVVNGGTLNGKRLVTSFSLPAPSLSLTVDVVGGLDQECSEHGGSTITANATTTGDLEVDRVEWWVDGIFQGNGSSHSMFIPLGGASVEAIAHATDGVTTDSQIFSVAVTDNLQPSLDIRFIDGGGNEVTSALPGDYTIMLVATDVCDPAPVASGSANPVMEVFNGDTITINSPNDVQLPTTAVEVTATAVDAAGHSTVAQSVLVIQ